MYVRLAGKYTLYIHVTAMYTCIKVCSAQFDEIHRL